MRSELTEAEVELRQAYSEAIELGAVELQGDAMIMLATIAGVKKDFGALEERAFVTRTIFGPRRPDKLAELLQVQGLALVEGDPTPGGDRRRSW